MHCSILPLSLSKATKMQSLTSSGGKKNTIKDLHLPIINDDMMHRFTQCKHASIVIVYDDILLLYDPIINTFF